MIDDPHNAFNNGDGASGNGADFDFDYEVFAREEAEWTAVRAGGSSTTRTARTVKAKPKASSEAYDWVQCLVAALVFCVIVFSFFYRIIGVIGISMVPTFHDGDRVLISNLFYEPAQGDIVVLRKLAFQEEPIIKRVIAIGGQTVEIDFDAGIVYVDGEALDEPYTAEPTITPLEFEGKIVVPENSVFVMGDNRNHSSDSRRESIGCVDERYIIGRVLLRVIPLSDFGTVE